MRLRVTVALLGLFGGAAIAQDATPRQPRTQEEMQELREKMRRQDKAPRVGQSAPAIALKSLDGEKTFDLATNIDKRPVILFFGSYT